MQPCDHVQRSGQPEVKLHFESWGPKRPTRDSCISTAIMVERVSVEGYDAFMAEVAKHQGKTVFALFSGSKTEDGKSWCPDCVTGKCPPQQTGHTQNGVAEYSSAGRGSPFQKLCYRAKPLYRFVVNI